MAWVDLVGWAAALTATLLGVPQAVRLFRTRNVSGLSLLAWQTILGINVAWTHHGLVLQQPSMIVPNALALTSTIPVLVLMARARGVNPLLVIGPGLLVAAGMIAVDLLLGTVAYGIVAIIPSFVANGGQSLALIRAHSVAGVSPAFLVVQAANQTLWLLWAILVADRGTLITAAASLVIAAFNLIWWLVRRTGVGPHFGREAPETEERAESPSVSFPA